MEDPIESSPVETSHDTVASCEEKPKTSAPDASDEIKLPRWVELDRKVLRFYGYFVEPVTESPIEDRRIRRITIYYYLADDTIHVEEPRQDNSGLTQGVFVRRHKIKNPSGRHYGKDDFTVGEAVLIYGRTFHIVDCDAFTRIYSKETLGIEQSTAIPFPTDPIDIYRQKSKKKDARIPPNPRYDSLTRYIEAKLGKPSNVLEKDTLKKYLDNNRIVLRFWCYWDDRKSLFGQRRPYVIHYFLEDDTGEVLECFETNSGRNPFPVFMKRGPLIKGNGFVGLGESLSHRVVYAPRDLQIGSKLCLNNREFCIYDCDDFTREWYKGTHGMSDEELAAIDITEEFHPSARPTIPPYNGFGSHEDSKQNCIMLVPKPPKKDFLRLMNKDQIVLRFSAKLCETDRYRPADEDLERMFIITYYMANDSIAIFERTVNNSGLSSGKFLERSRIPKNGLDDVYTYEDLHVGAKLVIHQRGFHLLEADEYTYTYMENNKHVFPLSDPDKTLDQLRRFGDDLKAKIRSAIETQASGESISLDAVKGALENAETNLVDHQIITLIRKFSKEGAGGMKTAEIEALFNL